MVYNDRNEECFSYQRTKLMHNSGPLRGQLMDVVVSTARLSLTFPEGCGDCLVCVTTDALRGWSGRSRQGSH